MIAIFTDEKSAGELSDKIHEYLRTNCPSYSAAKWQDVTTSKSDKGLLWYVQLPAEFAKELYPAKEKIATVCTATLAKATEQKENLPADWVASAAPVEKPSK